MNIIAITVSTNYEDYLNLILQENYKFFKKWYIVTEKTDLNTQKLCDKYDNVETVYFNFCSGNKIFNKGGGIKKAQQLAYRHYAEDLFLILDSDICITEEMYKHINCLSVEKDCVYGADRIMIPTIEEYFKSNHSNFSQSTWKNKKNPLKSNWWNVPWGYFQLYKTPHLYKDSRDAGKVDIHFSRCFLNTANLPLPVKHVGPVSTNWKKRITPKDLYFN